MRNGTTKRAHEKRPLRARWQKPSTSGRPDCLNDARWSARVNGCDRVFIRRMTMTNRTRQILQDLEAVRENLLALSGDPWLFISVPRFISSNWSRSAPVSPDGRCNET